MVLSSQDGDCSIDRSALGNTILTKVPPPWETSSEGRSAFLRAARDADDTALDRIAAQVQSFGFGDMDVNTVDSSGRVSTVSITLYRYHPRYASRLVSKIGERLVPWRLGRDRRSGMCKFTRREAHRYLTLLVPSAAEVSGDQIANETANESADERTAFVARMSSRFRGLSRNRLERCRWIRLGRARFRLDFLPVDRGIMVIHFHAARRIRRRWIGSPWLKRSGSRSLIRSNRELDGFCLMLGRLVILRCIISAGGSFGGDFGVYLKELSLR